MATEAQIRANRKNCEKSTGPKTAEGKARSRRNALKHGFRSESGLVPKRTEAKVRAAIERWKDELRPEGQAEESLVRLAAWSGAQLEALAEQHAAVVREQTRRAVERFETRRLDQAEALVVALEESTDTVVLLEDLATSSAGCAWIVREWEEIIASSRSQEFWNDDSRARVERLLDETARETFDRLFDARREEAARGEALADSLAFFEAQRDAWRLRGSRAWEEIDRPLRDDAEARALAPRGKEGDRWLRYHGMHAGHLHRSISGLLRIRTFDREPRPNDFQGRGGPARHDKPAPNEADSRTQPLGFQMSSVKPAFVAEPSGPIVVPTASAEKPTTAEGVRPRSADLSETARLQAKAQEIQRARELKREAEYGPKRAPNEANFRSTSHGGARSSVHSSSRLREACDQTVKGIVYFVLAFLAIRLVPARVVAWARPEPANINRLQSETYDKRPTNRARFSVGSVPREALRVSATRGPALNE